MAMKRLLAPLNVGVGATRHLLWYLNYQMTGETRDAARSSSSGRVPRTERT